MWTFAVLITGPIWAHQAWSSYWNWDPKEVWAFITWVVYAAYLHARSTAGWRGRKAAWLALAGVATLWFNFVGINYFSTTSQHSYAASARGSRRVGGRSVVRVALRLALTTLSVQLAQELRVVVRSERPWAGGGSGPARAAATAAAAGDVAWSMRMPVDGHREQQHDQ
ncbi:MAG: cytochrome c biogenesis protein CcsA [Nocardioides sp.]